MSPATPSALHHLDNLGSASGYVEEIYEVVGALTLFDQFTVAECVELCKHMDCYAAATHAPILREGDEGDFLIIVLTGSVLVSKAGPASVAQEITRVGPGGVLGEMSWVDGQTRFASCVANQPTDFAVLSRHSLNQLMLAQPQLANKILLLVLQLVTARLRDTTARLLPPWESDLI
jgi:CRP/FNR family transcriptional regulator, cyclic AMP receptor protein